MKKITKIFISLIITVLFISNTIKVNAAGSASITVGGNSTVNKDQNIELTVSVANFSGVTALTGYQVNFTYDNSYLEFISINQVGSMILSHNAISTTEIKAVGFVMSSGIPVSSSHTEQVFKVTFKAKKAGTTTVSFKDAIASDQNSQKITMTSPTKTIVINDQAPMPPSSNANLSSLSINGYTLTPVFNANTTTYTLTVPNDTSEITVNAAKVDTKASVTGTGKKTLNVGNNTVSIVVTAEDGTKKIYTINVVREEESEVPELDSDATLKSLSIGGYTLSPTFKPTVTNYTIKVGKNITGLKVDAVVNSSKGKVTITGDSGWTKEKNNVLIKVTAEDGSTKTYVITVEKEIETDPVVNTKSSNNYLSSLEIKGIELKFNKSTNNYNIEVPYEIDKLDVKTITADPKAKVKILGNSNLKTSQVNVVEVEVEAEDGSIRIYTLNVTRSTQESKNQLEDLIIDDYSLNPKFSKDNEEYNIKIPNNVNSLDVSAIPTSKNAKVEITGDKDLKEGNNVILVKVTDENGFKRIYQINVYKEPAKTLFGMNPIIFWSLLGLFLFLLLMLLVLLRKRKKIIESIPTPPVAPITPIIEFKPEFNFGSKNKSDDDVVYGGSLNQESTSTTSNALPGEKPKLIGDVKEAEFEEVPYDIYDDIVTKDEIIDSLKEAMETNNAEKLKFLLEQEKLNRMRDELKKKENDNLEE